MSSDLALKLRLLSVFGLSCIVLAVGLENTLGVDFTTILGMIGMTLFFTYFVRSNLEMGTPKFVGARKSLNIGLVLLSVGALVVSIAATENILSSSGSAGIPLEKKKGGELIPPEEKTKGSGKYKGFKVSPVQVQDIAKRKIQDLNARDIDHAVRIVMGTARSMGISVEA